MGLAIGALAGPRSVLAHDGSTTSLEVPVERVPPGSGVPLIGLDFFPGERLRIVLNNVDGSTTALGSIQAAADGHFEAVIELPAETAPGPVSIDAISPSGITMRAVFTVDPAAPHASYRPVFPTPTDDIPTAGMDVVPLVAGGLAIVGLAVLLLRTRRPAAKVDGRPR